MRQKPLPVNRKPSDVAVWNKAKSVMQRVCRFRTDVTSHPVRSFYVWNIPESAAVEDLRRIFESKGKLVDLYIPTKRDDQGGRFGFVRFQEDEVMKMSVSELDDLWIGTFKIRVKPV